MSYRENYVEREREREGVLPAALSKITVFYILGNNYTIFTFRMKIFKTEDVTTYRFP